VGFLLRLFFIVLLGFIGYRFFSALMRKPTSRTKPIDPVDTMVKCSQCDLHIPQRQAIYTNDRGFCSLAHQRDFLNTHEHQ
jgi:uncharacterized protein